VPSQDQSRLLVRLSTGVGANLDKTDALVQQAERVVHSESAIARDFTMVGGGDGVHTAFMFLTMKPPSERQVTQQEMAGILRKKINAIPGLHAIVQDLSQAGFTAQRGFPINFSVRGPDWDTLVTEAMRLKQQLQQTGVVVDLDTNYSVGMPELQITPNRARVADVGVSVEDVASTINALVGGVRVGKYNHEGRRIDVRMRLMADERHRPEDLARLFVRSSHGQLLPLASLVRTEEAPTMQTINRIDRERAVTIYANVAPGHSQSEVLAVLGHLTANMKTGYRAVLGGSSAGFQESMQDLYFALVLGIIVAYMVLASQFNSFLHPITVLTILPLSAAGAFLALWLCGKTLNIFSMIGILLLLGIVKKNSIVLVDYASHGGTPDETATDAMLRAGPIRLRPILMTSVATMMAVLPATLHLGPGAETRGPMGIAVMGGLLVSTALSLLVVPAFYVLADRLKKHVSQWGRHDTVAANID
jgi:multidrug efflux pump subunit AcrB